MTFAEKLKQLRASAGLTQNGLAGKSGVPVGTVREYEQARRLPTMPTGFRLARALGVTCEAFQDCEDVAEEGKPTAKKQAGKRK